MLRIDFQLKFRFEKSSFLQEARSARVKKCSLWFIGLPMVKFLRQRRNTKRDF